MKVSEFFELPEAPPIEVERGGWLGFEAPVKSEGEHYVPPWLSPDGKPWWTIEGATKRQTYVHKDEV